MADSTNSANFVKTDNITGKQLPNFYEKNIKKLVFHLKLCYNMFATQLNIVLKQGILLLKMYALVVYPVLEQTVSQQYRSYTFLCVNFGWRIFYLEKRKVYDYRRTHRN